MPKHLKTILMYEDVNDLKGSLEDTLKAHHLETMANSLNNDAQKIHKKDFNELEAVDKKRLFKKHLPQLQNSSGIQFDGYHDRKYKLQELLKRDHGINVENTNKNLNSAELETARKAIAAGKTQKDAAKSLGVNPSTLRGAGITTGPNRPPNDPEFIKDVLNRRMQGQSASQIAKNVGTTKNKIIGIWNRHG